MNHCSFCGCADVNTRAGRLALCAPCRAALMALSPGDRRYRWFVGAVRRALFTPEAVTFSPGAASNKPGNCATGHSML